VTIAPAEWMFILALVATKKGGHKSPTVFFRLPSDEGAN
jgi:hypothetical protein